MEKMQAYDKARKEFYDLRMQEDIERRIAIEEARATGAHFGKGYMDIGIELEAKALADWKEKAIELLTLKAGQKAAFSGGTEVEDEPVAAPAEDATEEETPTPVL